MKKLVYTNELIKQIMDKKKEFKILLVYPNIPLMTVPPLSMAIFTGILKKEGYQVELFDTTPYISDDGNLSQKNRSTV